MTTGDIVLYANVGDIATPDLNLNVMLRRNVVPAFMGDVGLVSWRRVIGTPITLTVALGKSYDLPDDFYLMQEVAIDPYPKDRLQYIGDDAGKIMAAEATVTAGRPGAYYLVRRTDPTKPFKRIRFDMPPNQNYTARFTYYSGPAFADDTTVVEMDQYIPAQFQWALVEALKREVMVIRFGVDDNRYMAADAAYKSWVARAMDVPELAHRTKVSYVR